jgi:UDP-glucose 4-epimerase
MRVVVIGATGNVGSAVLRRLSGSPGIELVGVARRTPDPAPPFDRAEWHSVDVADRDAEAGLARALDGADAVVHLAWLLQPNHDESVLRRTNVDGTARVLAAVAATGVPHVVVASSVGAYSPGPKRRVDESYPTGGVRSSHYARHKAENERAMDAFEAAHPEVVVTRLRPGLVMQGDVGAELVGLFLAPWIPTRWLAPLRLPILPVPPRIVSQVVHADDLADAVARIIERRAAGPFNLATEPVVGPRTLARVLSGRWLPVPTPVVRALLWTAWRLHLVRADPGWLDLASGVPLMDTGRARRELGWRPVVRAEAAVAEAIRGVARRTRVDASPHLR